MRQEIKGGSTFLLHFVLFRPSLDWMMSTHSRKGSLVSLSVQMLIPSGTTLTDHPEVMFNLGTTWPVKLTYKINHHGRWLQETQGRETVSEREKESSINETL